MRQVFSARWIGIIMIIAASSSTYAQGQTATGVYDRITENRGKSATEDALSPKAGAQLPVEAEGKLSRWIELQKASLTAIYLFAENDQGVTTNNQLQYQELFKARFKFDRAGRYSLTAGAETGLKMVSGYNTSGIGTGVCKTNLYLRQLYFAARPIDGLELQAGGLYINRGEATEITSYDNDSYIVGYRASLKRPQQLFFNEISVTYAYLGDLTTPNLMKRFHRLRQSNYHQFLVGKAFGKRAAISADYISHEGIQTLRQTIKLKIQELRVIDTLRFENYQRLDVDPAYGFSAYGEKKFIKRLTLGGGYASIDRLFGGLNGDRFNRGRRLFTNTNLVITPELSFGVFATRAMGNHYHITNRTRVDIFVTYDLLKRLQKTGWF